MATSATILPESVWQPRSPGKFGIASNADLAEARGQQALQASFQQETGKRKVVQLLTRHASTSVPCQKMLNHFRLACLLLNKLAGSQLCGSTCNLLVSGETTREVVHIFVDPARFDKFAGSKMLNHLFQQIVVDEWFKGLFGQHIG